MFVKLSVVVQIIFVALACVALAVAAPADPVAPVVKILRSDFDQQPEGNYVFR